MKILLLLVIFVSSIGYSQTLRWGSVASSALGFEPNGKVEIVNGKFYQIITNANNRIVISEYKPALLKWQKLVCVMCFSYSHLFSSIFFLSI